MLIVSNQHGAIPKRLSASLLLCRSGPFHALPPQGHALLFLDRTEHFQYTVVLYFSMTKRFYSYHFLYSATRYPLTAFLLPSIGSHRISTPPLRSCAMPIQNSASPFRYKTTPLHRSASPFPNVACHNNASPRHRRSALFFSGAPHICTVSYHNSATPAHRRQYRSLLRHFVTQSYISRAPLCFASTLSGNALPKHHSLFFALTKKSNAIPSLYGVCYTTPALNNSLTLPNYSMP